MVSFIVMLDETMPLVMDKSKLDKVLKYPRNLISLTEVFCDISDIQSTFNFAKIKEYQYQVFN